MKELKDNKEKNLSIKDFKSASHEELIVYLIDALYAKLAGNFLIAELITKMPQINGIKPWMPSASDIELVLVDLQHKGWYKKDKTKMSIENAHAILVYLSQNTAYSEIIKNLPSRMRSSSQHIFTYDIDIVQARAYFYLNDERFNQQFERLVSKKEILPYYEEYKADDFFSKQKSLLQIALTNHLIENSLYTYAEPQIYENLKTYVDICRKKQVFSSHFFTYYAFMGYDLENYKIGLKKVEGNKLYHDFFSLFLDFCSIKSNEESVLLARKFKANLKNLKKEYADNRYTFPFPFDLIYCFVMIKAYNDLTNKEEMKKDFFVFIKNLPHRTQEKMVYESFMNNSMTEKMLMLQAQKALDHGNLSLYEILVYFVAFTCLARDKERDLWLYDIVETYFIKFGKHLPLLENIYAQILSIVAPSEEKREVYRLVAERLELFDFTNLHTRSLSWQTRIDAIHNFITGANDSKNAKKKKPNNPKRLVWFVNMNFREIAPFEQSFSKDSWTKGRKVSAAKLKNNTEDYDYLTDQDIQVIRNAIKKDYWADNHVVDYNKAMIYLVNHPLVIDEQSGEEIELELKEAELQVEIIKADKKDKNQEDMYKLSFALPTFQTGTITECIRKNTYTVMPVTQEHIELKELMGEEELIVPQSVHEKVLDLVSYEGSPVKVHLAMELQELSKEKVNANPTLRLKRISTREDIGLEVQAIVYPLAGSNTCFTPKKGTNSFVARVKDKPIKIIRDFDKENKALDNVLASSPILKDNLLNDEYHWEFIDSDTAYQCLVELQASNVELEWYNSQPVRISKPIQASSMKLRLKSKNNWFSVQGEIQVDENLILDMRNLLKEIRKTKGRFIPLSDGQILALTDDFKRSLEKMDKLTQNEKDENLLHPLASPVLETIFPDFIDETDKNDLKFKDWKKKFSLLEEQIPLPKGIQADLRPYQIEGYNWLASLISIGAGACLADDMGLGKTLQTITLMTYLKQNTKTKEDQKPMLVIAPTSVCHNWELEFNKFSPSLEVMRLTAMNSKKERKEVIENLSENQILILGYSLLNTEISSLSKKEFKLVIFDEAQALKNSQTLRSKSSRELIANSKIALTGTPIENSLEDLWSIFNIVNPGLLGTQISFNTRFNPPASALDATRNSARNTLKSIVKPFILRRTKNNVLEELPSRTEQTIIIEPSAEERAFYEALRRQALENIEKTKKSSDENKQSQFHILAELTRLRRAACNPLLIDPNSAIQSTKMATLINIVQELIKNNHQALIFSQFTSHLKIIYEEIQKLGIKTFYLDGSTQEKKRAELVSSFQNGQADLFCISLKAGGQGLNLTAADYVIHLDPWWNPAVEDQASDRAYRIGQTRPVTIYRLIMQGSVEEKILNLHSTKRDLAEDILAETDSANRLSLEDLMNLLS